MRERWRHATWLACLGALAGGSTCAGAGQLRPGPARLSLEVLGFELFLGVLAVAVVVGVGRPPLERLGLLRGRLSAGDTALLAAGTLALSLAVSTALDALGLTEHSLLPQLDALLAGLRGGALALALLGLAAAPGLSEELLCRGLVQRGLERRLGPAAAIVVAALFFGALHLDVAQTPGTALLGLYLGTAAWLAASIRSAVICHFVNNAAALALAALELEAWATGAWTWLGFPAAAVALAGVWWRVGSPAPALPAPVSGDLSGPGEPPGA